MTCSDALDHPTGSFDIGDFVARGIAVESFPRGGRKILPGTIFTRDSDLCGWLALLFSFFCVLRFLNFLAVFQITGCDQNREELTLGALRHLG